MTAGTDPTMAGIRDPEKRQAKLKERIEHLQGEIAVRQDQIDIMQHEIEDLGGLR